MWPNCSGPTDPGLKALRLHILKHVKRRRCMVRDCGARLSSEQFNDDAYVLTHVHDAHPNATLRDIWPLSAALPGLEDGASSYRKVRQTHRLEACPLSYSAVAPTVRPAPMPRYQTRAVAPSVNTPYDWLETSPSTGGYLPALESADHPTLSPVPFEHTYRTQRRQVYAISSPQPTRIRAQPSIGFERLQSLR